MHGGLREPSLPRDLAPGFRIGRRNDGRGGSRVGHRQVHGGTTGASIPGRRLLDYFSGGEVFGRNLKTSPTCRPRASDAPWLLLWSPLQGHHRRLMAGHVNLRSRERLTRRRILALHGILGVGRPPPPGSSLTSRDLPGPPAGTS